MRVVTVCNIMSLDGFYEDPSGNPLALNMDQTFDAYNLERIRAADIVLLGRTSFEGFSSYWPAIADAPDDPDNRALSADNRELSRIYNELPKTVVSDSYTVPDDNAWRDTTTGCAFEFGSRPYSSRQRSQERFTNSGALLPSSQAAPRTTE